MNYHGYQPKILRNIDLAIGDIVTDDDGEEMVVSEMYTNHWGDDCVKVDGMKIGLKTDYYRLVSKAKHKRSHLPGWMK